ncbi:MAG: TIGR00266 family protein [Clostridia bacterium]|nr:TIGR00266 family protein [Clostridia bacterium]
MQYEILGDQLPVVVCHLDREESMITESGGMSWMTPNMQMETTSGGGIGKLFGRMFSGEHLFQNIYTAKGGPGSIAFASSFPGSIRPVHVTPEHGVIIQKSAFLASERDIELSVYLQKKFSTGLFSGEGFVMQKLTGNGTAFLEIDGSAIEYDLASGEQILVSSGHVAMMDDTCTMNIQDVKGIKNMLFGGEGFFYTSVTGPGHVILQTIPISKLAQAITPFMPVSSSSSDN